MNLQLNKDLNDKTSVLAKYVIAKDLAAKLDQLFGVLEEIEKAEQGKKRAVLSTDKDCILASFDDYIHVNEKYFEKGEVSQIYKDAYNSLKDKLESRMLHNLYKQREALKEEISTFYR